MQPESTGYRAREAQDVVQRCAGTALVEAKELSPGEEWP